MNIELAGLIIKNRDDEVLARRYFLDDYDLNFEQLELPTIRLGASPELNREMVKQFNDDTQLGIQILEQHPAISLSDPGIEYRCQWFSACAHNSRAMYTDPNQEWRFLSLRALKLGQVALGPHTGQLSLALRKDEIRLK